MGLIEAKNLSKHFRTFERREGTGGAILNLVFRNYKIVRAIDDISFSIEKGEIVGIIGPNGAGKSTLIKMMTGILVPTFGEVKIGGLVPHKNRYEYVKSIGVVFGQRTQLWWDIAVIEAFRLLQKIYEIPKNTFEERLSKFSEVLEISDFLRIPVRKLSLGQKMRCDLAASLLHNPHLVFLDEPTIGLDVYVKGKIREFILEMNQEEKTTIILTTHDLSDIEELCPRVMIIDSGKILFDGSIQKLKEKFGTKRRIIFEFYQPLKGQSFDFLLDGKRIDVKSINPYQWECNFDRNEVKTAELIDLVGEKFALRDLYVEETQIEEIVKKIYTEGII